MRAVPIIDEVEATGTFQQILRHIDGGLACDAFTTPLDAIAAIIVAVPISLMLWLAISAILA